MLRGKMRKQNNTTSPISSDPLELATAISLFRHFAPGAKTEDATYAQARRVVLLHLQPVVNVIKKKESPRSLLEDGEETLIQLYHLLDTMHMHKKNHIYEEMAPHN